MRVLIASALEASSLAAHAINTVKMAQGFAQAGHEVTIVCCRPLKGKMSPAKLNEIYGLVAPLDWIQLPSRWLIGSHWVFGLWAWQASRRIKPDLVYARNYIFPWLTSALGVPTVAESHAHVGHKALPFSMLVKATHHPTFKIWVTISKRLVDYYQTCGVPIDKLIVLPDAVDLNIFQRPSPLSNSPFDNSRPNIVYAGHLYDYKGIPTVLEAAKLLPSFWFHLVGGRLQDIVLQQERAQQLNLTNVTFHGLKPQSQVPPFLWHADVLLLPPSQHHPSAAWTSPLKLGEYLASGTPVVATDIPALRDWVTDEEVIFVPPDDPRALAKGIQNIVEDTAKAQDLAANGLYKAQTMSYKHRVEAILQQCKG